VTSKKLIITGADSNYYLSLLSLIRSLSLSGNLEYPLIIFDLGLKSWQIALLKEIIPPHYAYSKLPKDRIFDGWDDPSTKDNYAWKARIIQEVVTKNTHYIWIDSGVVVCTSLQLVFDHIDESGSFLIRNFEHKNLDWTSNACISEMNVTESELASHQLMGTFFGFALDNSKSLEAHNEWVHWCRNEKAVKGTHDTHRHDQTILSVIAARLKLDLLDPANYMGIGRGLTDYRRAVSLEIPFLSHRNWIYLSNKSEDGISKSRFFLVFVRSLPRHIFRWKLQIFYWARRTPAGDAYVSIRESIKKKMKFS
jgi:lipopolysaccharide biosynthesis glycosyltransferase